MHYISYIFYLISHLLFIKFDIDITHILTFRISRFLNEYLNTRNKLLRKD